MSPEKKTVAIVLAAGRGERLGADRPKAFVELAGRPLWSWSFDVFRRAPLVDEVVLAVPEGVAVDDPTVRVVAGGMTRSHSVRNALSIVGDAERLVVHDAARPLVTVEIVEQTIAALSDCDAAIAAAPVADTIKEADNSGRVIATLDRSSLWAIQTPQAFNRVVLEHALDVDEDTLAKATDDAWLVERAGGSVRVVPTSSRNFKVTTPDDLRVAEFLLTNQTG